MDCPPVLHALAWPGELAGAPRSMEETLAALVTNHIDASAWLAVGGGDGEPLASRLRDRGVAVEVRSARSAVSAASVAALTRALRARGPEVVLHTHGERALLWGTVAARLARARHVHTNHGFIENDDGQRRRVAVARRLLRRADAVVAVHASATAGLPGAVVVPNCLDADRFTAGLPDRATTRRHLTLGDGDRCYLFLGRLSPEKGADLLGLVQARLQARSGAARLFVAGSGELAPGVAAMADVQLLGQRQDAGALLAAADAVLMPSRREGLPMVALEAAATGTPVVGFAVGGLADSGLARPVPVEDVDRLVDEAIRVVRDADERRRQLEAAQRLLKARYSPPQHASELVRIYRVA